MVKRLTRSAEQTSPSNIITHLSWQISNMIRGKNVEREDRKYSTLFDAKFRAGKVGVARGCQIRRRSSRLKAQARETSQAPAETLNPSPELLIFATQLFAISLRILSWSVQNHNSPKYTSRNPKTNPSTSDASKTSKTLIPRPELQNNGHTVESPQIISRNHFFVRHSTKKRMSWNPRRSSNYGRSSGYSPNLVLLFNYADDWVRFSVSTAIWSIPKPDINEQVITFEEIIPWECFSLLSICDSNQHCHNSPNFVKETLITKQPSFAAVACCGKQRKARLRLMTLGFWQWTLTTVCTQ